MVSPINSRPASNAPLAADTFPPQLEAELSGLRIGQRSCVDLLREVRQDIDKTFANVDREIAKSPELVVLLNQDNILMLVALRGVNAAMKNQGIQLTEHDAFPEHIGALIKASIKVAVNCKTYKDDPLNPRYSIDKIDLRVKDLLRLQTASTARDTPFDRIQPGKQWHMCIDPKKVHHARRLLDEHADNPLLPFLFDSQTAYLYGMLNSWRTSMDSLEKKLDATLVMDLYTACFPSGLDKPIEPSTSATELWLIKDNNMTTAGCEQLLKFAAELRQQLPSYAVVGSKEDLRDYFNRLHKTPKGQSCEPKIAIHDKALLFRPELSTENMRRAIQHFILQFKERCREDPLKTNRLRHIAELCQSLEQLHPFPDGNCRVFGVILLNHLLAREGLPLSMLEDPNILDGWSLDEVVEQIEKGQQRVAEWTSAPKPPKNTTQRQATDWQAKLANLFKK